MERLSIWIPGQPARVTHQSGTRITGHRTYKTTSLIGWENTIARGLRPYIPDKPIKGPVLLKVTFGYKAKTKKDLWTWKITRPDTDNSIKTIKDVMTRLGFWEDDSQVVHETCKKMWVDQPGVVIVVEELAGTLAEWRIPDDC